MSYMDTAPVASWTVERARVAALSRDRDPDDPELIAARRRLAEAMVLVRIERILAGVPLSDGLRARVLALVGVV